MDVDLLIIRNCPIPLLRVLLSSMGEEACANRLSDPRVVLIGVSSTGEHGQLEPVHDGDKLLTYVLCSSEGSGLNEIFKTPSVCTTLGFPGLVHCQKGKVVSIRVVEFGLLLVS